jgi:hypothetical protein
LEFSTGEGEPSKLNKHRFGPKTKLVMALVPQGTTRTKWTRELTQDGEVSACLASNFLAKLQTHVVSGFNKWA